MLSGRYRKHVGDIAVKGPARLDAYRINQNQFGESLGIDGSDFSRQPPAHRKAHEDGIPQIQFVDQIEIKKDQILNIIKVFRYWSAGEPGMYRLYDLVPFRQSIREG
jgi:hypothetical protein